MISPGDRRLVLQLFLAIALLYMAISRGVFLYGDDILMFQVTEAIVDRGYVAVSSPWEAGDNAQAIRGEDGRGYAKYGIGQSLAAIPLYVVSKAVPDTLLDTRYDAFGNQTLGTTVFVTSLTNALLGAAVVAVFALLLLTLGYGRRATLVLSLILALATPLAHYTTGFLSEPLLTLALLLAIYGMVRAEQAVDGHQLPLSLAICGFGCGLAIATRAVAGVMVIAPAFSVVLMLWFSKQPVRCRLAGGVAWAAPLMAWLALVGLYNASRFGSVLETGYGDEARQFTTPLLDGLVGLLLSPGKGLLWYAPPLVLTVWGARRFARRRPMLTMTVIGMLWPALLVYGRYYAWEGGGVWGPRFLLPLLPLLLLPAAEVLDRPLSSRQMGAAAAVAAVGLWLTAIVVFVPFDTYVNEYTASSDATHTATWSVRDSPIVVHSERIWQFQTGPDIAAVRYHSVPLAIFSAACLAGAAWLLYCLRRTYVRITDPGA